MKTTQKTTIFSKNQSFGDILTQGIIFVIGAFTALAIASGIIIAFSNIIH